MIAQNAILEEAQANMKNAVFDVTKGFRGLADLTMKLNEQFSQFLTTMTGNDDDQKLKRFLNKYVLGSRTQFDLSEKASGGGVNNGMYMVGERGPELLSLNKGSSGYVYNNGQTRAMMGMAAPRYSGGPVTGGYKQFAGQVKSFGDSGSIEFDNMGNAVGVHLMMDTDTLMSRYTTGHMVLERTFNKPGGGGTGYSYGIKGNVNSGEGSGYIKGPNGEEIPFNDTEKAAEMYSKALKAAYGLSEDSYGGQLELIAQIKEQTKVMKQMFAKLSTQEGVF